MNRRRAPALFPDDLMPRIADLRPELLDDAIENIEVRGIIGCAGNVAVAEAQHTIGGKADGHIDVKDAKSIKYVKRDAVKKIIAAWIITVPAASILAAAIFFMIKGIMAS